MKLFATNKQPGLAGAEGSPDDAPWSILWLNWLSSLAVFVSAGGGSWYSNTLNLLKANDRIWVKAPGYGFVGVGRVTGPAKAVIDFKVIVDGQEQLAVEALTGAEYHRRDIADPEKMEYFVPVKWAQTVPLESAVDEIGLFGNQNTACAPKTPKWTHTIERLKQAFPKFNAI